MIDKVSAYTQTIAEIYPDFPIRTAYLHNEEGQFNDVLMVNGEWIFRFPRYAEGIQTLENEVWFLRHVQGGLSLPIPHPVYVHIETQNPAKNFMGYRMLPGTPLWQETLAFLDNLALKRVAGQLAEFLISLHTLPVEVLINTHLPVYDQPDNWHQLYAEIRDYLYPFMRPDVRTSVSHHFESYLNNPELYTFQPALRHGDFGAGNILFNTETNMLCGVIDFGFAGIGDPAIDIAAVSTLEPRLFVHFQRAYPHIAPLLARAAFYKGTYALQEALHGLKNSDLEAFENGMADYK